MRQTLLQRLRFALRGHGIVTLDAALGTGPVVARNVEDDGVFVVALGLDILQKPADLIIRVRQKARINFHLMSEQFLLAGGQRIPSGQFFRPRR